MPSQSSPTAASVPALPAYSGAVPPPPFSLSPPSLPLSSHSHFPSGQSTQQRIQQLSTRPIAVLPRANSQARRSSRGRKGDTDCSAVYDGEQGRSLLPLLTLTAREGRRKELRRTPVIVVRDPGRRSSQLGLGCLAWDRGRPEGRCNMEVESAARNNSSSTRAETEMQADTSMERPSTSSSSRSYNNTASSPSAPATASKAQNSPTVFNVSVLCYVLAQCSCGGRASSSLVPAARPTPHPGTRTRGITESGRPSQRRETTFSRCLHLSLQYYE